MQKCLDQFTSLPVVILVETESVYYLGCWFVWMKGRTPDIGFSSHKLNKCQILIAKMPKCIDQLTTGSKGHIDDIRVSLHSSGVSSQKKMLQSSKRAKSATFFILKKLQQKKCLEVAKNLPNLFYMPSPVRQNVSYW